MRLLADESVDFGIIECLREYGYEVESIAQMSPGIDDDAVLQESVRLNALLLTEDKDFGELTIRFKRPNCGIVLIRAHELTARERAFIVRRILDSEGDRLMHCFTAIGGEDKVRIRRIGG
jgi:predicted nuclease of predicted toxin-antitoxin system